MCLAWLVKKFEIWWPRMGGPRFWSPQILSNIIFPLYLPTFNIHVSSLKSLNFEGLVRGGGGGNPRPGTPNFCFVLFIFYIYPFWKFDPSTFNSLKVQNFGRLKWRGSPPTGHPQFLSHTSPPEYLQSPKLWILQF